MKNLKLKAVRIQELATVVDAIPLKDLLTAKDIRLASSIVKDLLAAIPDLAAASSTFDTKKVEIFKANNYVQRYNEESALLATQEEKEALAKKIDQEFNAVIAKELVAEAEAVKTQCEPMIEAELGDEKFAKLKEVFEKFAHDMYRSKEAYLEVADALEL